MTPELAGRYCDDLDKCLRGSEMNLHGLTNMIRVVLRDEAWRRRRIRTGEVVECDSFLELLTAPPLKGFGEDPAKVEALLKDDAEALRMFRDATIAKKGKRKATPDNTENISIKSSHGTGRAYTLSRLQKTDPALYQRVVRGELSAHAAALVAGLVKHKCPLEQLRHWWKKATPLERARFLVDVARRVG